MPCLDFDELTVFSRDGRLAGPGVREHLRTCDTCKLDLLIMTGLRDVYLPERQSIPKTQVPPGLNRRILARIARRRVRRADVRPADSLVAAVLGVATVLAAVFVTGTVNAPGVTSTELALLAAAGGTAAAWLQSKAGKRNVALALELI